MASTFKISLARIPATWTANSADTNWPVANLESPHQPFLPWKTTAGGDQWARADFGSAQSLGMIALIRTNFTSVRIQGNATDVWTSPSYNELVTVTRNPENRRFQHAHLPGTGTFPAFNYRYFRIFIPSQTPVAEKSTAAALSVYLLGGMWAGALVSPPRALDFDIAFRTVEPKSDVRPESGAWRQRSIRGEPYVILKATRKGQVTVSTPASGDQVAAWEDLDRLMAEVDVSLFWFNLGDTSKVWPMRRLEDPEWRFRVGRGESDLELEEVIR